MFFWKIFIILMLYFVSSIQRFNYNYLLICTIFYLKQVLLIFPIHNILQILPILILFHDLIDFHQLFFADPSIQICDFFQTGNFGLKLSVSISICLCAACFSFTFILNIFSLLIACYISGSSIKSQSLILPPVRLTVKCVPGSTHRIL